MGTDRQREPQTHYHHHHHHHHSQLSFPLPTLLLLLAPSGSISAPPDYFGETLEEEQLGGGSFVSHYTHAQSTTTESAATFHYNDEVTGGGGGGQGGGQRTNRDEDTAAGGEWARLVERELGHTQGAKLYGGSQYHRSLREFALAVQHMSLPEVTADEIANAAGVNDVHGERVTGNEEKKRRDVRNELNIWHAPCSPPHTHFKKTIANVSQF